MKKTLVLILALLFLSPSLCACGAKRMDASAVEEAVRAAVSADVALLSSAGSGELRTYTFSFGKAAGTFEVVSYFYTETGSSKKTEELHIYFERDYAALEEVRAARAALAAEYGISEEYREYGQATVTVANYADLPGLARYIEALDRMYAFEESAPDKCEHISCGTVCFSESGCSIPGRAFSFSASARLRAEEIEKELALDYVTALKRYGLTDETVPDEVRDSVGA